MHVFSDAFDDLNAAERAIEKVQGEPTPGQLLQIAQIKALLSISQELSQIHHNGINPLFNTSHEE